MEIFIAFTKESSYELLKATLEAWEKIPDAEPVGIQVPSKKYEIVRRVTAENMAAGDYILCDLGCVPNEDEAVPKSEQLLRKDEKIGMIRFSPDSEIRVCRKGIVEKWPINRTGTYQIEHEQAYILEGYTVPQWPTLSYRKTGVH